MKATPFAGLVLLLAVVAYAVGFGCARRQDEAAVAKERAAAELARARADSLQQALQRIFTEYSSISSDYESLRRKLELGPKVVHVPGTPLPPETIYVDHPGGPVPIEVPGEVAGTIRSCDQLKVSCDQMQATAELTIWAKDTLIDHLDKENKILSRRPTRSHFLEGAAVGAGVTGLAAALIALLSAH